MGKFEAFRSAHDAVVVAERMLAEGEPLHRVWRFGIAQMLDDYLSVLRHEGPLRAGALWSDDPGGSGDARVDAAFAGMAEHLARKDGWPVPLWVCDSSREAIPWWFVATLRGLHPRAMVESPLSFRRRGVFITSDALERV